MRHPSSTRRRDRAATYNVWQIADESHYANLPGGVLESAGRLFKRSVKMYVYPTRDPVSGQIHSVERAPLAPPWPYLRDLLIEIGRIEPIRQYDEAYLSIHTPEVRRRIETEDPSWEAMVPPVVADAMVPPVVADMIKTKQLFGYHRTGEHP